MATTVPSFLAMSGSILSIEGDQPEAFHGVEISTAPWGKPDNGHEESPMLLFFHFVPQVSDPSQQGGGSTSSN